MEKLTLMNGVLGIHDRKEDSIHCYGSKGLRLWELAGQGFEVPDGFLISVECISWLVKTCGMDRYVSEITASEAAGQSDLEEAVKQTFRKIEVENAIARQFLARVEKIRGFDPKMYLAVRSAALGEDDGASSYAGQYATVLDVAPKKLFAAIFECYASWWSDRVMAYRKQMGIPAAEPKLSVIVQRQLCPEFSGVLFTRHPITGKKDTMVIESVEGLGEKLVSGKVTPERWEISEKSGTIGFYCVQRQTSSLNMDKKNLRILYDIGKKLENHFGRGMDMEWAIEKNHVYVLQARPITSGLTFPRINSPDSSQTPADWAGNIYARAIVEDLWADRMSEITGSIVFDEFADHFTFKPSLRKLKMNDIAEMEIVKVINGYGYLSSQVFARLLELIPRSLRFREIFRMFPVSMKTQVQEAPFNWKKAVRLLSRFPFLINDPAMIPLFTGRSLKRHLAAVENELNRVDMSSYPDMTLEELGNELERVLKLQGKLQERNQWGYGNAAFFTWLLRHLATGMFKKSEQWVLDRLTRIPSNITLLSQEQLNSICLICDKELLEKAFKGRSGKEIWEILSSEFPRHPVTQAIESFVATYRFRSANRDFIHPRWDEAPEIVVSMMAVMIGALKKTPEKNEGPDSISEKNISQGRYGKLKDRSVLLSPLVNATRNFLALREDLRFCLDKIFYRIRKILLAVSRTPQFSSLHDVPNGIFFMTLKELRSVFSDKLPVKNLRHITRSRKESYYEQLNNPPAYFIRIDNPLEFISDSADSGTTILTGVPASSGVVEGIARVIHHPDEFHSLKPGEILVAFNTDPGWTPLFMSAAGVVVEMGGILNHCAIVAREYGIPAVVGIEGVSRNIETGRRVRLNGNLGLVELL